jgi:hypothetical protein
MKQHGFIEEMIFADRMTQNQNTQSSARNIHDDIEDKTAFLPIESIVSLQLYL